MPHGVVFFFAVKPSYILAPFVALQILLQLVLDNADAVETASDQALQLGLSYRIMTQRSNDNYVQRACVTYSLSSLADESTHTQSANFITGRKYHIGNIGKNKLSKGTNC